MYVVHTIYPNEYAQSSFLVVSCYSLYKYIFDIYTKLFMVFTGGRDKMAAISQTTYIQTHFVEWKCFNFHW